jgi:hypothetical protein
MSWLNVHPVKIKRTVTVRLTVQKRESAAAASITTAGTESFPAAIFPQISRKPATGRSKTLLPWYNSGERRIWPRKKQ